MRILIKIYIFESVGWGGRDITGQIQLKFITSHHLYNQIIKKNL